MDMRLLNSEHADSAQQINSGQILPCAGVHKGLGTKTLHSMFMTHQRSYVHYSWVEGHL